MLKIIKTQEIKNVLIHLEEELDLENIYYSELENLIDADTIYKIRLDSVYYNGKDVYVYKIKYLTK